jgi:hypothetical protein
VPEVTGSFSIRRFAQTTEGEVAAVGILTLSLTDPTSNATRTIITQVAMPVAPSGGEATPPPPAPAGTSPAAAAEACAALSLTLGPVDLELLGMTVRLDQINLDLVPRSSARLGMLLCGATSVIGNGAGPAEQMNILNMLLDTVG